MIYVQSCSIYFLSLEVPLPALAASLSWNCVNWPRTTTQPWLESPNIPKSFNQNRNIFMLRLVQMDGVSTLGCSFSHFPLVTCHVLTCASTMTEIRCFFSRGHERRGRKARFSRNYTRACQCFAMVWSWLAGASKNFRCFCHFQGQSGARAMCLVLGWGGGVGQDNYKGCNNSCF